MARPTDGQLVKLLREAALNAQVADDEGQRQGDTTPEGFTAAADAIEAASAEPFEAKVTHLWKETGHRRSTIREVLRAAGVEG